MDITTQREIKNAMRNAVFTQNSHLNPAGAADELQNRHEVTKTNAGDILVRIEGKFQPLKKAAEWFVKNYNKPRVKTMQEFDEEMKQKGLTPGSEAYNRELTNRIDQKTIKL